MPEQVALSINPAHAYAAEYIDRFARDGGVRTVALWLDDRERRRQAWRFPALMSPAVAGHVRAPGLAVEQAIEAVAARYEVVAVAPYAETVMAASVQAARILDLDWYHRALDAVRDKGEFKARLRAADPGLRVNASAVVQDADDALRAADRLALPGFVLKPNDGYGNAAVAGFARDADPGAIAAHLGARTTPWILEEWLHGTEYFANGQVDALGDVAVVSVGRHVVDPDDPASVPRKSATEYLHTTDPAFAAMARYAESVLRASGLRRVPFHLEAIIDDAGPCLVELGARLAGGGLADSDSWLHARAFDPFGVAVQHLIEPRGLGDLGLSWEHHDAQWLGHVRAASDLATRAYEVRGTAALESDPAFVSWWRELHVGDRVERTTDLLSIAWEARLQAPTLPELRSTLQRARVAVTWNDRSHGLRRQTRRARALAPLLRRRILRMRGDLRTRARGFRARPRS